MNKYKFLMVVLFALLTAFTFGTFTVDSPIGILKKVVNEVKYKPADKSDWVNAKAGQALSDRDELKTGDKSLAIILFSDGSGQLRVRENSSMQIYGQKNNKQLNKNTYLQNGSIGFDINKQENEEFKFTTPTAVASIRGTAGLLGSSLDSTYIVLEHGVIELRSILPGGGNGTIKGGQSGSIDRLGKFISHPITPDELYKLLASHNTNTKKVKIKVNNKILEIEYLSQ